MVEHRLAKARVEGSNPFSRSKLFKAFRDILAEGFFFTPGFTPGSVNATASFRELFPLEFFDSRYMVGYVLRVKN